MISAVRHPRFLTISDSVYARARSYVCFRRNRTHAPQQSEATRGLLRREIRERALRAFALEDRAHTRLKRDSPALVASAPVDRARIIVSVA
jgi:hypothetical protein